ncbi:ribonuclease T2 [Octodon degus]|uniref:Ribonuclease T2 n=1 Tax=Octodon degus TaxID=10160 RepID=A0A6P3FSZ6_OCTDE|nr:ribonuclease T2 [Octodon degus]
MAPRAVRGALLVWALALCCLSGAGRPWSGSHEWKKLILTQLWPPTLCKEVNDCEKSPDYWTIHGLWPDKVEDCNSSWHFHLDEIKDLFQDMNLYWPDIKHPLNGSRFWKHEWEKHGTCAAQLDALDSEKKYFGKSLVLYKQLDLTKVLQKLGIEPSINYYYISDFKDALTRIYGVVPKIQCLPSTQGENVQTISQIELCFTKEDFRLRNCTEPGELPKQEVWLSRVTATQSMMVCEDGPVFYPPPKKIRRTKYYV